MTPSLKSYIIGVELCQEYFQKIHSSYDEGRRWSYESSNGVVYILTLKGHTFTIEATTIRISPVIQGIVDRLVKFYGDGQGGGGSLEVNHTSNGQYKFSIEVMP